MKRIISITPIILSVFALLAFEVLPHHHHGEKVCMEFCVQDHVTHEGCNHGNEVPEKGHDRSCISELKYTASRVNDETQCKVSSCKDCHDNHMQLLSVHFLTITLPDFEGEYFCPPKRYSISFCKSIEVSQSHGLRAPPAIFS